MKTDKVLELEGLTGPIKLEYRWLTIGENLYFLRVRERDLMQFFMKHPNRVWALQEIAGSAWRDCLHRQNIAHHIMMLRNKIEEDPANPRFLRSVGRGGGLGGYILVTDPKKEIAMDKVFSRNGWARK